MPIQGDVRYWMTCRFELAWRRLLQWSTLRLVTSSDILSSGGGDCWLVDKRGPKGASGSLTWGSFVTSSRNTIHYLGSRRHCGDISQEFSRSRRVIGIPVSSVILPWSGGLLNASCSSGRVMVEWWLIVIRLGGRSFSSSYHHAPRRMLLSRASSWWLASSTRRIWPYLIRCLL